MLALLEAPDATLISLMRLLTDKPFRQRILTHVTDPVVRAFWETELGPWPPKFKAEAIAPIQNKIGQFLSYPLMRSIVGQNRGSGTFFGPCVIPGLKTRRRKMSQTPGSSICDR